MIIIILINKINKICFWVFGWWIYTTFQLQFFFNIYFFTNFFSLFWKETNAKFSRKICFWTNLITFWTQFLISGQSFVSVLQFVESIPQTCRQLLAKSILNFTKLAPQKNYMSFGSQIISFSTYFQVEY